MQGLCVLNVNEHKRLTRRLMIQVNRTGAERAPLTQMQRQLWAVLQLFPDKPVNNTAWRFDLGAVDVARFSACFDDLVRRVDALRMVVEEAGDAPRLRVCAPVAGLLEVEQTSSATALDGVTEARARRPLDIAQRPMEPVLYHTPDGAAVWLLNLHHIVNDGASGAVLFDVMAESYAAGPDVLPPLPSFADHLAQVAVVPADRQFWETWRRTAPAVPRC